MMRLFAGLLSCILLWGSACFAQNSVAIVGDGPGQEDPMVAKAMEELRDTLGDEALTIRRDADFQGNWTLDSVQQAIGAALADPGVDVLLVTGALGSVVAESMPLPKPVVVSFLQRSDLFDLHELDDDRSPRTNLSFIWLPNRLQSDIQTYFELQPFNSAHVALDEGYVEEIPDLDAEVAELESSLGLDLNLWPVGADPLQAVKELPATAEAVILGPTPRLSASQRKQLIEELNAKRIPTYSLKGHADVHAGALAGRTPETELKVARRVAFNLSEILSGREADSLPVILKVPSRLLINGQTARQIGFSPRLEAIVYASILHEDLLSANQDDLALVEAMRMSAQTNLEMAMAREDSETAMRDRQLALSPLLPQAGLSPYYKQINAGGLEGLVPESQVTIGVGLQQMIYDDAKVSNLRTANRQEDAALAQTEAKRLDVIEQSGAGYLNMALAQAIYRVEADNLLLTEDHLDMANLRLEVGYSGRDEVYRWEAEMAKRRSNLFSAITEAEVRQVIFNQIMGQDQSLRWRPESITAEAETFPFLDDRMNPRRWSLLDYGRFEQLVVDLAMENSPELQSAGLELDAQGIQVGQRKRRWWLPAFNLNLLYEHQLSRDPEMPGVDRDYPQAEIRADYPIFLGASRSFEVSKQKSRFRKLDNRQTLVRDLVERRARTSLHKVENSFSALRFAQLQAEAARKNFTLVQDRYSQGLVNVTDLLEAQNEQFTAEQVAEVSVYQFHIDLIRFQRAIAWFEFEKTPAERDELAQRIQQRIQSD